MRFISDFSAYGRRFVFTVPENVDAARADPPSRLAYALRRRAGIFCHRSDTRGFYSLYHEAYII